MGCFPSRWSVMSGVCLWCNTENGSLTKGPFKVLLSAMTTAHWSQCGKLRSTLYSHRLPVTTLKKHLLHLDTQEICPNKLEITNVIIICNSTKTSVKEMRLSKLKKKYRIEAFLLLFNNIELMTDFV